MEISLPFNKLINIFFYSFGIIDDIQIFGGNLGIFIEKSRNISIYCSVYKNYILFNLLIALLWTLSYILIST